jgi:hypothetical protein
MKRYNLYRIVDIDVENEIAHIQDLGDLTQKEVFRLFQSYLYVQYTIDQDDIRQAIIDAIHQNDAFSLRMYQSMVIPNFIPMDFAEMCQKYYTKNSIKDYSKEDIYAMWNGGVDFIFSDTKCALT